MGDLGVLEEAGARDLGITGRGGRGVWGSPSRGIEPNCPLYIWLIEGHKVKSTYLKLLGDLYLLLRGFDIVK